MYRRTLKTKPPSACKRFTGLPRGPADLNPAAAPLLLGVSTPARETAHRYTDTGLAPADLPTSYPYDSAGRLIPHDARYRRSDHSARVAVSRPSSNG